MDVEGDESFFKNVLRDKHLRQKYKDKCNNELKELKKDFKLKGREIEDKIKQGIRNDQEHRRVINLSIFPFTGKGRIGSRLNYYFYRAAPLFELTEKNMDFLILKEGKTTNKLIVGEGKGSVSNPHKVVQETLKRIETFENNLDYVKKTYLSDSKKDTIIEYVITVNAIDANDICREIIEQDADIITWKVGFDTVSIEIPHDLEKKSEDEQIKSPLLHKDKKLTQELKKKCDSSSKFLNIFPQSETFSKLKMITLSTYTKNSISFVDKDGLNDILKKDLFYLKTDEIEKEREFILSYCLDLGFLKPEDGELHIVSKWNKARGLEDDLKNKYISYRKTKKYEEQMGEIINKIRSEFKEKQKRLSF